ncbi:MAG TPA: S24 family peptidase [Prolixibacteraceae bacterium]
MDINQRFEEIINQLYAGNKRAFSLAIGVAPTVIENVVGKRQGNPSFEVIQKVASANANIDTEWLLTGTGSMIKEEKASKGNVKVENTKEVALKSKADEVKIPLVTIAAVAGFGNPNFAIQKSDVKDYYVVPKFKDRRVDFMIEIAGSSMYPKYSPGDVVACTILRESKFIQWNKVHVIGTAEQGILIKRVKKGQDDNHLMLISDNKDYDPFTINTEEITGMAIVIGVIRLE